VTAALGHTSILLAFFVAVGGIISPIVAARAGDGRYLTVARLAILAQFVLVTLAATALIYGLVTTDFSIKYVAFNTTRATPVYYRVTGLWGALEGSLLLWEWILIIFSGVVAWLYRGHQNDTMPWVIMLASSSNGFKPRPSGGMGEIVSKGFDKKPTTPRKKVETMQKIMITHGMVSF